MHLLILFVQNPSSVFFFPSGRGDMSSLLGCYFRILHPDYPQNDRQHSKCNDPLSLKKLNKQKPLQPLSQLLVFCVNWNISMTNKSLPEGNVTVAVVTLLCPYTCDVFSRASLSSLFLWRFASQQHEEEEAAGGWCSQPPRGEWVFNSHITKSLPKRSHQPLQTACENH